VAIANYYSNKNKAPYNTHFNGYGLGWFLSDVKDKQVTHTGGLEGIVKLPIFQSYNWNYCTYKSTAAFNAITNTIKDSYLGITSEII
jgi:hypothetical protein